MTCVYSCMVDVDTHGAHLPFIYASYSSQKLQKSRVKTSTLRTDALCSQYRYASRKGIPYTWFPPFEEGGVHEVKDMASEKQVVADPATWSPA